MQHLNHWKSVSKDHRLIMGLLSMLNMLTLLPVPQLIQQDPIDLLISS